MANVGALDALRQILAPQGILTVTTGGSDVGRFLERQFGTAEPEEVRARFEVRLEAVKDARVVIIGVPVDLAGFEKGQGMAPTAIRSALLGDGGPAHRFAAEGVIDIGDCRNHPLLAHDSLLNTETIERVRAARWGAEGADLPVAPLSILERALRCVASINPSAKVLILGGDHALSWMPFKTLATPESNPDQDLGIVHFDAHTDLLDARDGVEISFATWAYHANALIGRGGRLQQLGIRTSGKDRSHWERTMGVRQFWADEIEAGEAAVRAELLSNLEAAGVRRVYISNDIDGTDPRWAAATGTMEPGGMRPEFVLAVIEDVARKFEVVGADVVEVAPTLKERIPGEPRRTLKTAASYVLAQLDALLGQRTFADAIEIPEPCAQALIEAPSDRFEA